MGGESGKRRSAVELMGIPTDQWDPSHLQNAVQIAIELELSTLPPYLCGLWSISDPATDPAPALILGVAQEEMLHLGLVCNMLKGLGGTVEVSAPTYPGGLPGGVRPDLTVHLSGLTKDYVADVYMQIEYPEAGPVAEAEPKTDTIGAFYDCIAAVIGALQPSFDASEQLTANVGPEAGFNEVYVIPDVATALKAITEIKEQGEGTATSPDAVHEGDELAHFYRFGEIFNGKQLVPDGQGGWSYTGADVRWPNVYPTAQIPPGGWPTVPDELAQFRQTWASLLSGLQDAWQTGGSKGQSLLGTAIDTMFTLKSQGIAVMNIPLNDGSGLNYLPDFKLPSS